MTNSKTDKGFYWSLSAKQKNTYFKIIDEEIDLFAKFTCKFSNLLNLNLDIKTIKKEMKLHFSFYSYHFLSSQLQWLKIWQDKLKDNELLIIVLHSMLVCNLLSGSYVHINWKFHALSLLLHLTLSIT